MTNILKSIILYGARSYDRKNPQIKRCYTSCISDAIQAVEVLGRTYEYGTKLSSLYQKVCSESQASSENKDLQDLNKNALKQVLASGALFQTVRNYFERDNDLGAVTRSTKDMETQIEQTKTSLMLFMDKLAEAIPPTNTERLPA